MKNEKLPANILTPTTKASDHDVPVTQDEVSFAKVVFNSVLSVDREHSIFVFDT